MPITQAMNSKGNVKKFTNNDVPYTPQFPVVNRYETTSTASQTVINLNFSVDQSNTDSFFLFVDGKALRSGSANDYTFTAISSTNTSSQITLNYAIIANLNIIAIKLGVKKEAEFLMDNRFTQLYANQAAGFQGFISQTDYLINPTTTTGTPTTGSFYSSVVGRASMPDLSQDLKPKFGIERTIIQNIYQLQNEFGPNGEPVWATPNDTFGQIRFVGSWTSQIDIYGPRQYSGLTGNFIEIVFYGTGLNLITLLNGGTFDCSVSVDGIVTKASGVYPTSNSGVLQGRNFSPNQILPCASGLTLGLHTVTLTSLNSNGFNFAGFEILNQNATPANISVNPGIIYNKGQQVITSAQNLATYNSGFTNTYGTAGTTGGRVLVYQTSAGAIQKDIQYNAASASYLASTSHTNEEPVRTFSWREFGAGRTDDFSRITGSGNAVAFTLDDGTTTLLTSSGIVETLITGAPEGVGINAGTSNYIAITFVGTGLDILGTCDGTSRTVTVTVDGTSQGTLTPTLNKTQTYKICSGLPYGTHVVTFNNGSASFGSLDFNRFIVYQPKTPTLLSGAVQLGSYNLFANFTANTSQSSLAISAGTLRKTIATREAAYVGTWTGPSLQIGAGTAGTTNGFYVNGATAANYVQYTFFGTGFDFRFGVPASTALNVTVSIDGTNPTAAGATATGFTSTGVASFSASTGVLISTTTNNYSAGAYVSGLPLGLHTVKIAYNSGSSFTVDAFDIITPIYSPKSNVQYDAQNTLLVGSCALSDDRRFSPIKDAGLQKKNVSQAAAITSTASTTSTVAVPCPDMSVTHSNTSGRIRISYAISGYGSSGSTSPYYVIYIDGVQYGQIHVANDSTDATISETLVAYVSPGVHKIDVYWGLFSAIGTANVRYGRQLLVEEI